ncbi:DUF2625 family protein [Arthrobacter sp. ISL-85]|nr:DUF2625 family protein [Arthrobacter sp. ISL-85]
MDAPRDGHTAFIEWLLNTGVTEFYRELRWLGWEPEVSALCIGEKASASTRSFAQQKAATLQRQQERRCPSGNCSVWMSGPVESSCRIPYVSSSGMIHSVGYEV